MAKSYFLIVELHLSLLQSCGYGRRELWYTRVRTSSSRNLFEVELKSRDYLLRFNI